MSIIPALLAMAAILVAGVALDRLYQRFPFVERLLVWLIPDPDLSGRLDEREES